MYNKIGSRMKKVAVIIASVGCLAALITAVYFWSIEEGWTGFFILLGGCLVFLLGGFVLYGFGELIEQTSNCAKQVFECTNEIKKIKLLTIYNGPEKPENLTKEMIDAIKNEVIEISVEN